MESLIFCTVHFSNHLSLIHKIVFQKLLILSLKVHTFKLNADKLLGHTDEVISFKTRNIFLLFFLSFQL